LLCVVPVITSEDVSKLISLAVANTESTRTNLVFQTVTEELNNYCHIVRFLLGNSPTPEFYMARFRNTVY
jgi:hypothetical protein